MTTHFKLTYAQLQTTPIGEWITVTIEHGFSYLHIRGKHCMISLEEQPSNFNRGPFCAKLDVLNPSQMHIDFNDGWNGEGYYDGWSGGRYYFNLDRAKAEIEAWLRAWNQLEDDRISRENVLYAFAVELNQGHETLKEGDRLSDDPL